MSGSPSANPLRPRPAPLLRKQRRGSSDPPRICRACESAPSPCDRRRQVARWSTSGMQTGGNSGDRLCALPKEEGRLLLLRNG
jgi:hypothetical protein